MWPLIVEMLIIFYRTSPALPTFFLAREIKNATTEAKRVATQLQLMAGQLHSSRGQKVKKILKKLIHQHELCVNLMYKSFFSVQK